MCTQPCDRQSGFSLVELVLVVGLIATLAVFVVPGFRNLQESSKARNAALLVDQELQQARLKAVSTSSPFRVRLNCPLPGQLRTLEVTGVASTDTATNRCDPTAFPSPGPNDTLRSTPSLDSPVIYLPSGTSVASSTMNFQFDPQGKVSAVGSTGTVTNLAGDVVLTIIRGRWTHTVTVNSIGRIRLD